MQIDAELSKAMNYFASLKRCREELESCEEATMSIFSWANAILIPPLKTIPIYKKRVQNSEFIELFIKYLKDDWGMPLFAYVDLTIEDAEVIFQSLIKKIDGLIAEIRNLIKYLKVYFFSIIKLDLRLVYRKIVRFLFKNLNDNSGGDGLVVYNLNKQFEVVNLKEILYERKSTINKGY